METYNIVQLVIAFVAGINLPVIIVVIRRLGQIRDQLAAQNGRVGRLEEWRIGEDRRTDEMKDEIRSISQRSLHRKD